MNTASRRGDFRGISAHPSAGGRARSCGVGLLLLVPLLGPATPAARAQVPAAVPAGPVKSYVNKSVFHLPVMIDDRTRAGLRELQLFAKEGPGRPWALCEKAPPTQPGFTYRAAADGEFWFTVVTVDLAGRATPADINVEPPGLIVVLDTKVPQLNVLPLPGCGEGLMVRCEVKDANPDPFKIRFEYQTGDKVWRNLDPLPGQPEVYCIPQQAVLTGMVRVTATDLSGNTATREINLGTVATPTGPVASAPLPEPAPPRPEKFPLPPAAPERIDNHITRTAASLPGQQAGTVGPTLETVKREFTGNLPPAERPDSRGGTKLQTVTTTTTPGLTFEKNVGPSLEPEAGRPSSAAPKPAPRQAGVTPTRQLLNGTHAVLEYQIDQTGPSGVGKVEVWMTRNQGHTWQRLGEDADRKSPVEIDLPGEGVYGVSLVGTNGRGFGGTPPQPGDTPDWWLEVDTSAPVAELQALRPGSGEDSGALHVVWSAQDKNLGETPIDLFYAKDKDGPWLPIARGLRNDGTHRWQVPADLTQTYVRLVVTDRAGNVCQCETAQPVPVDDQSRPRARVTGVASGTGRLTPPSGH